jgi:hypothetical protein
MRGLARLLLIGMLVLLLPFKGMAAAGYMPGLPTDGHGRGHEVAGVTAHPCHEVGDEAVSGHADSNADSSAGTCKHCAPCCVAVAPMTALVFASPSFDPPHLPQAATIRWAAVALALPDRPPRNALA